MGYIIYMDVYFLINFMMNSLLLWLLRRVDGKNGVSIKGREIRKIGLGAMTGSVLSCFIIPVLGERNVTISLLLIHGIVGYLMIWIAFDYKRKKERLRAVIRFNMLEIMVSGILNMIIKERIFLQSQMGERAKSETIHFFSVAGVGTIAVIIMGRFLLYYRKEKLLQSHLYEVELLHKGKSFKGMGLLDTGNHLKDPFTGKAVVISTLSVMEGLLGKEMAECVEGFEKMSGEETDYAIKWIPFHSIGKKHGFMPGIILDEMTIFIGGKSQNNKNILVGIVKEELSSEGKYQVILHEDYMEQ